MNVRFRSLRGEHIIHILQQSFINSCKSSFITGKIWKHFILITRIFILVACWGSLTSPTHLLQHESCNVIRFSVSYLNLVYLSARFSSPNTLILIIDDRA